MEKGLQQCTDEKAVLCAVAAAASSSLQPDEILSSTLEEVIRGTGFDIGWVVLPSPGADRTPRVLVSRGVPESILSEDLQWLHNYFHHLLEEMGESVSSEPMVVEFPSAASGTLVTFGLHNGVCVTLTAYHEGLAFLCLARRDPDASAGLAESSLKIIGYQIGLALRSADFAQEASQVDRLRTVNEIMSAVVSSLEMCDVLDQILEMTCRALKAAEGSVLLKDPQTGGLLCTTTLADQAQALCAERLQPGQGIAGWTAKHKRAVFVNDVDQDTRFYPGIDAVTGFETRSLICAPMAHGGEILGVLEFVNKRRGEFDEEDLSLLEAVASIAAVALRNARLHDSLKRLLRECEEAQARMIHIEKMSALGRLTTSIAHEINNPLQAVQGYLSLTQKKLDDPRHTDAVKRYLGIASEEVARISDIVSRMRDFYRPEREGFWSVDVDTVIKKVLVLTQKQLERNDVTVERFTSEDLPTIEANADQLKQVFLNLVINAISAMPEGGTLYIHTALEERGVGSGAWPGVHIDFTDTGIGMSEEVMDRLFEPFFTTKEDGTGLGLSISYGIIQAHGGEISVVSQEGKGTKFTVRLPLEQPGADRGRDQQRADVAVPQAASS